MQINLPRFHEITKQLRVFFVVTISSDRPSLYCDYIETRWSWKRRRWSSTPSRGVITYNAIGSRFAEFREQRVARSPTSLPCMCTSRFDRWSIRPQNRLLDPFLDPLKLAALDTVRSATRARDGKRAYRRFSAEFACCASCSAPSCGSLWAGSLVSFLSKSLRKVG